MGRKIFALVLTIMIGFTACKQNPENNSTISQSYILSEMDSNITDNSEKVETYYPENWNNPVDKPIKSFSELGAPPVEIREVSNIIDNISVSGELPLPIITNETPLVDVISIIEGLTVIPGNLWNTVYHDRLYDHPSSETGIPVSFLRQKENGSFYTVAKLKDGGYAYFFYERPRNYETLEYITDDYTEVYFYGCVYMEDTHQKSDYDDLKVGDSIKQVIAIDSATKMIDVWREWNEDITGEKFGDHESIHLLTDGLISIHYGYVQDEYVIKEITYSPQFIYNSFRFKDYPYPKDFSILPQDYPPET